MPLNRRTAVIVLCVSVVCVSCDPDKAEQVSARPPTVTTAVANPLQRVTQPWAPGKLEFGLNIYWSNVTHEDDQRTMEKTHSQLDYVVSLGANSLAVAFPLYTDGWASNSVHTGPDTPGVDRLRLFVDAARERNLRVTLRPLLDEKVLVEQGTWRGGIEPENRDEWFSSIAGTLRPYAAMAQDAGVTTFVVASEMNSLGGDVRWQGLIDSLRSVYHGEIGYASNWDRFLRGAVDVLGVVTGVDAYFPVDLPDTATVDQLVKAWKQQLASVPAERLKQSVISEVGIPAEDGAFKKPFDWGDTAGQTLNLDVQAKWFETACRVMADLGMPGIYYWKLDFNYDPHSANPEADPPASFVGRPAETAIRQCFEGK